MRHSLFVLFITCTIACLYSQAPIRIISYNVENLFDYEHDSLKNDSSFLPEGLHHWTYPRYQTKLDRISQIIVNISGWESVPIIGLCEVENSRCLRDLCYRLKRFHYRFIHFDSPDERGVDVALLYDSTKIHIVNTKAVPVRLVKDYTRDILYACCVINQIDTLHILVCHLPSQLGGSSNTEDRRIIAKGVIQSQIDSIFGINPSASIIVMGDMNAKPSDDLDGMTNLMIDLDKKEGGTHKHRGLWSCLDQFYVSNIIKQNSIAFIYAPDWLVEEDTKFLHKKPYRTYIGYRYHNGYSDHLPIVLHINTL